ncbi:nucleotide sugar dehydrogenase [Listeria fleischmannii]|uniref:Nucleotide sugar dehydrogenase n=1 Tax=Listeria fleischmannii TaxID=1069827 RepID=A0A841YFJ6_9LIST|nr:nucleotide sugar dehydrogenase [Listeria fleischmannii]MBC1399049.1 nucleotide sugar dehydrogenase [Listeria fleischmannii]MBC1427302.1 nucleotide sugar dehydrogenase [Listeria fleischmannii]
MKITVLGMGYIGLPTAIMFANHNQDVLGVDVNPQVVEMLQNGQVHIEEPGLQEALNQAVEQENFRVGLTPKPADVFIVAVPTPNNDDALKSCNLDYVLSAVEMILPCLRSGNTIIVESTIAPRSMEDFIKPLVEKAGFTIGKDVFLVHCPERVLPGQVIHELVYNNRIIGGVTPACTEAGKQVYGVFVKGELIEAKASVAEMAKLMENTYRDVNIALANELVKVCDKIEINALEVIEKANKHPRVNLHHPGPGVGGHCLAVDPYFIASKAEEESPLIQTAREINTSMPEFVIGKVNDLMADKIHPKIVVMGLTYKGDIDDARESPAVLIYQMLEQNDAYDVVVYEPHIQADFIEKDLSKALDKADLVLVLTDHSEFKTLSANDFSKTNNAIVIDTKNVLDLCKNDKNYFNLGSIFELKHHLVRF